ncbi:MAG: hypothetical protein BWY82_01529 [Verrucomicrobia bacterium ADurb.Bin474]|nr:MAG: hypothetical protein BWY82_01529 [Verrucomicrobia bacterium ADurb.Bin474]
MGVVGSQVCRNSDLKEGVFDFFVQLKEVRMGFGKSCPNDAR